MSDSDALLFEEIGAVLRARLPEIADTVMIRYRAYYAHSSAVVTEDDFARSWTQREVFDFLDCITSGKSNHNYASWVGDTVPSHYELVSPLANRMEMILLYAEVCAEFLWEEYVVEATKLQEVLAVFEQSVMQLLASDTEQYLNNKLIAGTLEKTWRLGPHSTSPANTAEGNQLSGLAHLSRRQIQIARFVAKGKSNAEIAAELGISTNTVKNHLAVLFDKLNVNSRTELALKILQEGLLDN